MPGSCRVEPAGSVIFKARCASSGEDLGNGEIPQVGPQQAPLGGSQRVRISVEQRCSTAELWIPQEPCPWCRFHISANGGKKFNNDEANKVRFPMNLLRHGQPWSTALGDTIARWLASCRFLGEIWIYLQEKSISMSHDTKLSISQPLDWIGCPSIFNCCMCRWLACFKAFRSACR